MPSPRNLSPLSEQAYADLPDDVLLDVLERAAEAAESVRILFKNVEERREEMRDHLLEKRAIRSTGDLPECPGTPNVAAVDGGVAIERSIGADTALALALCIEGLTGNPTAQWNGVQYKSWQKTLPHVGEEMQATANGMMSALELLVLTHAKHDVVLLDGSHFTPILSLNALLRVTNDVLLSEIADAVQEFETPASLLSVMQNDRIVALPKYTSSRDFVRNWLTEYMEGAAGGLDDAAMLRLLMRQGEYTVPQTITLSNQAKKTWSAQQLQAIDPHDEPRDAVRTALNAAVDIARSDQLLVTYFRPFDWSRVFRLEIKKSATSDESLSRIFCAIRSQIVSPEISEPYPQWVADRMAKSVGGALNALRAAVNYDLADRGMSEYIALIAHSYRTEVF